MQQDIEQTRKTLESFWNSRPDNAHLSSALCAERWNNWSHSVRKGFIKRAATALMGSIQLSVRRKEWEQWEQTAKFCLDDFFSKARECEKKTFDEGIRPLLESVVEGRENDEEEYKIKKRISEMLKNMKHDPQVASSLPQFNPEDSQHEKTLLHLRSAYSIQWATYIVAKLIEQNE